LEFLHMIGLFDRPARQAALQAVIDGRRLSGVSRHLVRADDERVLERLRKAGLVAPASSHQNDLIDTHTLVRDHFAVRLREEYPKSFTEAHRRLYEFYAASAPHQPNTLKDAELLLAAVAHGCAAGLHREASEIYRQRLLRGGEYFLTKELGAFAADLTCLGH